MKSLFESTTINKLNLPNRFVRSATWEGMATDDGAVTPKLTQTLVTLAKGGVGLIITGHIYVLPEGQASPWQLGIHKDTLVKGLKTMTEAVHEAGGTLLAQLSHAGHFALESSIKGAPHVVSGFDGLSKSPRHEMRAKDLVRLINGFKDAAVRAQSAGFDGIELHCAHSYLLSQFLAPAYNRRKDGYGGSLLERSRIIREIIQAIREAVGQDFPILAKVNSEDFLDNGLTRNGSLLVCRILEEAGLDAVEISGGTQSGGKASPARTGITSEDKEAYFREACSEIKQELTIPVILVGGIRSFSVAESIIKSNTADYVSMCRPLIREPGIVNRWKSGDHTPSACKSDNLCFRPGTAGKGIYCLTREKENRQ